MMDIGGQQKTMAQMLLVAGFFAVFAGSASLPAMPQPAGMSTPVLPGHIEAVQRKAATTPQETPASDGHQQKGPAPADRNAGNIPLSHPVALQLNLVNPDGNMTEVVYPGKLVALELMAAHGHGQLGVPVVTKCSVSNPFLERVDTPFSHTILTQGCGQGDVLPTYSRFWRSERGYTTPFFPLPPSWTREEAFLLFACDVIICHDVSRCQQPCPPLSPSSRGGNVTHSTDLGPHDVIVRMESQVVTSCPQPAPGGGGGGDDALRENDAGDAARALGRTVHSADCFYGGDHRSHDDSGNVTAQGASGWDAVDLPPNPLPVTLWPTSHFHIILVITIIGMAIIVFMLATFCKLAALQRQVESCGTRMRAEMVITLQDHKNQETQTPPGRQTQAPGQNPSHGTRTAAAHYSRGNGGGGGGGKESVTLVDVGDSTESCPLTAKSMAEESCPLTAKSMAEESCPLTAKSIAEESSALPASSSPTEADNNRLFFQPRSRAYDVPPSHHPIHRSEKKVTSSMGSVSAERLSPLANPRRSQPKAERSSPESSAGENDHSQKHTTVVESRHSPRTSTTPSRPVQEDDQKKRQHPTQFSATMDTHNSNGMENRRVNGVVCGGKGTDGHDHRQQIGEVDEANASLTTPQRQKPARAPEYYNLPDQSVLNPAAQIVTS
ncbi:uncharacterized protein LOC143285855 [Babylonia areolata]|uniref:uncharacterized protein LOC143285855 n=1 Tax=Babylonia areolata TaxID=304850 RepID=UPI003FD4958A